MRLWGGCPAAPGTPALFRIRAGSCRVGLRHSGRRSLRAGVSLDHAGLSGNPRGGGGQGRSLSRGRPMGTAVAVCCYGVLRMGSVGGWPLASSACRATRMHTPGTGNAE
jgi:hypothetical protein